jgi:beta-N-acetylhexosaminidase
MGKKMGWFWLAIRGAGCLTMESAMAAVRSDGDPMEQQIQNLLEAIRGLRVGLLTNPTGVDNRLNLIADRIFAATDTTLVAFFAPEHGLRGDRQAGGTVEDYIDPVTGLPVYSVYGSGQAPTPEELEGLDALIFDIQDVGVRFYTYIWTMTYSMEAAAASGVRFIVFDRPILLERTG